MEGMQVCIPSPVRPLKRKQYDGFDDLYAIPQMKRHEVDPRVCDDSAMRETYLPYEQPLVWQGQLQQNYPVHVPEHAEMPKKITESDFPDVSMMSMRQRSVYQNMQDEGACANNENILSMDHTLMKHVQRTSKPPPGTFSLGYRANCPRCLRREPGHLAHILDERGNAV
eukprot:Opistho-2@61833